VDESEGLRWRSDRTLCSFSEADICILFDNWALLTIQNLLLSFSQPLCSWAVGESLPKVNNLVGAVCHKMVGGATVCVVKPWRRLDLLGRGPRPLLPLTRAPRPWPRTLPRGIVPGYFCRHFLIFPRLFQRFVELTTRRIEKKVWWSRWETAEVFY